MTLEALQYLVTDLALKHNLVNCAMSGPSIYAINPEDIKEYPLIFVSPTGTHTIKENTTRYSLTFFYMDRLFEDSSNEETINSAGIETLRNLKLQLSKIEVVTDIQEDADIRLFTETERMADRVAGAYMTIWIETLNPSTCPAFFDEYGFFLGNYFATEGLENVLDGLASKEWVERLIAGLSISGITPEEFERIMGDYVLRKNFATINGSGITNKERFSLVEQGDYDEFLSAYTTEIQNIWNSMTSGGTPADYDAVKGQVSANTRDIAALSAQTSANTAQIAELEETVSGLTPQGYEELKQQVSANTENIAALSAATQSAVSGINETIEIQNSAITGINETLVVLSAQTSANTVQIADLSGFTHESVSSLTHDIETLSETISGLTPQGYEALRQQVSANTEDIAELSGLTTDLSGLTTDLSGVTSGLSSDLQALSSYTGNISELVSANTNSITNLNGQVTGLTSDLVALSAFTETLTGSAKVLILDAAVIYSTPLTARTAIWEEAEAKYLSGYTLYLKGTSAGYDVILPLVKYQPYTEGGYYTGQLDFVGKDGNLNNFFDVNFYHNGNFYGAGAGGSFNTRTIYTLPTASASGKGGIKVGTGLSMNGEVMSADVASNDVHNIVSLTQSAYDALATRDANTLYIIKPLY